MDSLEQALYLLLIFHRLKQKRPGKIPASFVFKFLVE